MAAKPNELPMIAFATPGKWRGWLRSNHAKSEGLWVKLAKKSTDIKSITYAEAREAGLIYGWIDGQKRTVDASYYALRFTPRRKRSKWSKINREIVEGLTKAGKMKPAGLAVVEAAKADGRWLAAYAGPATMKPHPEFLRALKKNATAKKAFATISSANRYAILYAVADAKRAETRARRIDKYVAMLAEGDVPHPGR